MPTPIKGAEVKRRKGTTTPKPEKVSTTSLIDAKGRKPGSPKRLVGVFFGPPKTAKTTLACSGEKVLLVNFDPDGADTMTLKGRDDITVVEPESWAEVEALIRELHSGAAAQFDWIVIDSLTFLFQMVGGQEIYEAGKNNTDPRRAYGRAGGTVVQFVNDFVALRDSNVIFTAHLQTEHDGDDGVVLETDLGKHEVKVAVTPMVWKVLGAAVSFVGRTYRKRVMEADDKGVKRPTTKYFVSFNDGEKSPAGSRFDMAGEYEVGSNTLTLLKSALLEGGN